MPSYVAFVAMCAPDRPLTRTLQSLPHSLRSGHALSGATGQRLCRFLLFQPLGQQNLKQRLIGYIALVRQHFEPGDQSFGQAQ